MFYFTSFLQRAKFEKRQFCNIRWNILPVSTAQTVTAILTVIRE